MEFFYHELDNSILVLSADGGLNADTAGEFVGQVESLVDAGVKKIIIDCDRLNYISSYGLGVLVRLHNKIAKHGGDVKVAGVKSLVHKVMSTMRLTGLFELYPDVDRARLAFRSKHEAG